MAAKGKWAQGIVPRHFHWVIEDRLAICERPGGYGANHRRVRRQEEILWVREQGFDPVVSLIAAPHNLHNYDELGVRWRHRPLPRREDYVPYLREVYAEMADLLDSGAKLLYHQEELSERVIGLMAGFLVWSGVVAEEPKAVFMLEQITGRPMGPHGREFVSIASKLEPRDA